MVCVHRADIVRRINSLERTLSSRTDNHNIQNLLKKREIGLINSDELDYLYLKYLAEAREWQAVVNSIGFSLSEDITTEDFLGKAIWGNYKLLSSKYDEINRLIITKAPKLTA